MYKEEIEKLELLSIRRYVNRSRGIWEKRPKMLVYRERAKEPRNNSALAFHYTVV